jgi:hypothetical protein
MTRSVKGAPCTSWPDCVCATKIAQFSDQVDDWIINPVPREVILGAMPMIQFYLKCILSRCPDPLERDNAARVLRGAVWKNIPKEPYPRSNEEYPK